MFIYNFARAPCESLGPGHNHLPKYWIAQAKHYGLREYSTPKAAQSNLQQMLKFRGGVMDVPWDVRHRESQLR